MIPRLINIMERIDRWQHARWVMILLSAVGVIAFGVLFGLTASGNGRWLPEIYQSTPITSTIVGVLLVVGIAWLGHGLTASILLGVAGIVWMVIRAVSPESGGLADFVLAVATMTLAFIAALDLMRLLFSLRWQPLAVARMVLDEAVRMKLALIFIIGLILFIPILSARIELDTPLRYRIQTFISYGTGASYALLAVMTIFIATATVAFEQRDKQIYQIVSKPISRFNYLLGKWIGVMGLNFVLLVLIGGSVFWFLQYLNSTPALDSYDRLATSEQVLTSRVGVRPTMGDILEDAEAITRQELIQNEELYRGDPAAPLRIYNETIQRLQTEQRTVDVGSYKEYVFENVKPLSKTQIITAQMDDVIFLDEPLKTIFDVIVTSEDESIRYARGTHFAVNPNLGDGHAGLLIAPLDQQPTADDAVRITPGQRLRVQYFPANALTLRFKIDAGGNEPGVIVPVSFLVPSLNYAQVQQAALMQTQTVLIPAGALNESNTLIVQIANGSIETGQPGPLAITFPQDGLEVMYKVSNFEANYIRAMLVIWMKLGFLAMLGIAAATFASFPVACLLAFAIFLGAEMGPYMSDALEFYRYIDPLTEKLNPIKWLVAMIARGTNAVLRIYGDVRPAAFLTEGRHLSWATVMRTAGWIQLGWTGAACIIGWLVFRSRQLAIYSGHA
ncbi:MAG: hypothetical protein D8M59_16050 [Planctomycetes bacterium]|nr:hypothetical protein [Planctomycetota bacterium]NOG54038.1 hypothetical protein [Planctomycetota bacterium]